LKNENSAKKILIFLGVLGVSAVHLRKKWQPQNLAAPQVRLDNRLTAIKIEAKSPTPDR
jgi:hypothetical protein